MQAAAGQSAPRSGTRAHSEAEKRRRRSAGPCRVAEAAPRAAAEAAGEATASELVEPAAEAPEPSGLWITARREGAEGGLNAGHPSGPEGGGERRGVGRRDADVRDAV